MKKILLFAGTTEGRKLSQLLCSLDVEAVVCVATDYGKELLEEHPKLKILAGRLDSQEIEALLRQNHFYAVIDTTHPYALEVTENIKKACIITDTNYIRLKRRSCTASGCIYFAEIAEIVDYLNSTSGNILLTTGSKNLEDFTAVNDFANRIFPRVLPAIDAVQKCRDLGFSAEKLICMQGPFSEELNLAILRQYDIKFLVTKDSGDAGGFKEKLKAAKKANTVALVLGRPIKEDGYSMQEIADYLVGEFGKGGSSCVT